MICFCFFLGSYHPPERGGCFPNVVRGSADGHLQQCEQRQENFPEQIQDGENLPNDTPESCKLYCNLLCLTCLPIG